MTDLHMHSLYSEDGQFTPEELVELCRSRGVDTMSITDHNCVKANERAQAAAERSGIRYITGIEIDCAYGGVNFHVLGYGIDVRSPDFAQIEENVEEQVFSASLERLDRTRLLGFSLTENEMWQRSRNSYWQGSWTGEMFAEVLLAKPEYADHPLLRPYRSGGARSDNPFVNFFWDYYAQGKPCYVELRYPSMEKILDVIHEAGGKAVLAHPGVNLKGREELLDPLLSLGMDGIEVYSSYHSPAQAEFFRRAAAARDLLVTCGSDFHGKTKPSVSLAGYGDIPDGVVLAFS